jgi:hypothetical protein
MALSLPSRLRAATAMGLVAASLLGCQLLGPSSIKAGRISYNEAIQNTGMEQTFINIIRVHNNEQTAFVDVSQISATVLGQGTLSGNIMNIGVPRANGGSSLALEYQESPTIQYQPLIGAALISQIATPISAVSLGNLSNSDWSVASILMMAVNRMTPGYLDYAAAVNAMIALDDYGALDITPAIIVSDNTPAATSPAPPPSRAPKKNSTGSDGKSSDTSRQVYQVLEVRLETRNPGFYGSESPREAEDRIKALWNRLCLIYQSPDNEDCQNKLILIFRTPDANIPIDDPALKGIHIHILLTRSAYGILKAMIEGSLIEFVDQSRYEEIRKLQIPKPLANSKEVKEVFVNSDDVKQNCEGATYYTVLPPAVKNEMNNIIAYQKEIDQVKIILSKSIQLTTSGKGCLYTTDNNLLPDNQQALEDEHTLLQARRLMLIITTPYQRPNSYIGYFDRRTNMWYSIDAEDRISQRNFILLSQFLTIQASATPPLPLTPTISVGSK